MKKTLLFIFYFFLVLSVFGDRTVTPPIFNWAEKVDGPGNEHARVVRANTKGELFLLSQFRNPDGRSDVYYQGQVSEGQEFGAEFNSMVNNVVLHKIKKDGTLIWAVSSNFGDVYLNNCNVIPTNDEGALLLLKARHSSGLNNTQGTLMYKIVSASGFETSINFPTIEYKDVRFYSPLLIKLTKDGEVEWTKREDIWHTPKIIDGKEAKRLDCFSFHDGVTDEYGNFYITGILRDTLYWTKPDLTKVKMIPNNTAEWDGDTQAFRKENGILTGNRCDLYVLKLNSKGEYVWHKNTTGDELKEVYSKRIAYEAGSVYIAGSISGYLVNNAAGDADPKTIYLGDKALTVEKSDHLIFAKLSALTGEVDWFTQIKTAFPDTNRHHRMKSEALSVSGDVLLTGGSFTGAIALSESDTLKVGKKPIGVRGLTGYALKLNASTGDFEAAQKGLQKDGIDEVRDIYLKAGKVYAFDTSRKMYVFDENMNRLSHRYLVAGQSSGLLFSATFVGNDVFLFSRGRRVKSNDVTTFYGTDKIISVEDWGNVISSFKIPDIPASVRSLSKLDDSFKLYVAKGEIIIDAEKRTPITIYSISGQIMMRFIAVPGTTVKSLAPGIYIVNNQKVIVL